MLVAAEVFRYSKPSISANLTNPANHFAQLTGVAAAKDSSKTTFLIIDAPPYVLWSGNVSSLSQAGVVLVSVGMEKVGRALTLPPLPGFYYCRI